MKTVTIEGFEFDVKRLTISEKRGLIEQGISLLDRSMNAIEGEVPFSESEVYTILEIAFPQRLDDIENLSLMGLVELVAEVCNITVSPPEKN